MRLFNSDGSRAEVSGNGVRALAALLGMRAGDGPLELTIDTEGGSKRLTRFERDGNRQLFRAAMGLPISWARPADSRPTEARRSERISRSCASRNLCARRSS